MAIEVLQNEEISGGGKNGEKESVLPSVWEERIGGAYTQKSEEEPLREMLTPR